LQEKNMAETFNFKSTQVTTVYREWMYDPKSYNGAGYTGYAALTSQMHIQNFRDVESGDEIEMMRKKLIELGGNPVESIRQQPLKRA
jgi:hypothetical protein